MSTFNGMRTILHNIFGSEGVQGLEHLSKSFDLQKAIERSDVAEPGYSALVPQLESHAIDSLNPIQKIALVSILSALSARTTESAAVATPGHCMATFSWETLQHILTQAPYLEYDRSSPTVPQSWEATVTDTHWFGSPAPFPDPSIIHKLLLQIKSRQDDGSIDSLNSLSLLLDNDGDATGSESTKRPDKRRAPHISENKQGPWNRVLIEIGILRFPDSKDTRFTIVRHRLMAWVYNEKHVILPRTATETGITIEQFINHFSAREDIINRFSAELREQALQQVDTLVPVLQAMESMQEQIITLPTAQQPDQAYSAPIQGPMSTSPARTAEPPFDATERECNDDTDRGGLRPRSILGKLISLLWSTRQPE